MIAIAHRGVRFECETPEEALALAERLDPWRAVLEPAVPTWPDAQTTLEIRPDAAVKAKRGRPLVIADDVEAYIRKHPGVRPGDAYRALHVKASRFRALVAWLRKAGRIRVEGNTHKRRLFPRAA